MSLPSPVFGSPVSVLPSHLSVVNTKNPEITHGRDPGVPQGMMSGGSWELSRGSEGRKNYSLCSLSSFSSGLRNAGTGESVKLQARPILQQGPGSELPAEEELLQFKKGGGSLLCFTHTGSSSSCSPGGNVCPSQTRASATFTRQNVFVSERRRKFRAVKDEFCISDI